MSPGKYDYSVIAGPRGDSEFGTVLRSGSINLEAWDVAKLDISNNLVSSVMNSATGMHPNVIYTLQHTNWMDDPYFDFRAFPFGSVRRMSWDIIFGFRTY